MSIAVVTVAAGGLPVVDVTATTPKLGLPVTEATNGIPVTKVTLPKGGLPVTFVAASGVPASISGTLTTTEARDTAIFNGTVAEAFSGPGDAVPGMVAAWGTHAFDAAAIGPNAQTVVRASDSAAQSFTPLSNGANNKASITTFLTATTGKTSVLFDQVGALDATQTTAGNRPAVTLSGPNSVLTTTFTRASSHFLNCGNSSTLNPTTGMSFSMWVSTTSSGGSNEYWAIGRDDNVLGRSYCFGRTGDLWTISVNGGIAVTFTKVLAANTLMHFAGTGDAVNGWRMYIDGVLVTVGIWLSPNVSTANTNIGRRSYAGFEGYWDGTIDDVIIDNRAWSAPEVFSIYNKGKVFFDPAFIPTHPAAAVGYNTLVFFDDFNDTSNIDMADARTAGFKWYRKGWFGLPIINTDQISITGSVLKIGNGTGVWPNLMTAIDTGVVDAYTGTVFGGGCYIEVRMKFDPSLYTGSVSTTGIPNFYCMSIEHIADPSSTSGGKWPGQASGYAHFIEVDIFEPNNGTTSSYFSVTHDWGDIASPPGSGDYPINITNGANNVINIGEMDFTKFHTYGCLWVPQVGATPGRLQRFVDGALAQSLYFLGPPGSPPLPVDSPNSFTPEIPAEGTRTYSVIDTNRLALLIGGGTDWPIHIDWVKVWKGWTPANLSVAPRVILDGSTVAWSGSNFGTTPNPGSFGLNIVAANGTVTKGAQLNGYDTLAFSGANSLQTDGTPPSWTGNPVVFAVFGASRSMGLISINWGGSATAGWVIYSKANFSGPFGGHTLNLDDICFFGSGTNLNAHTMATTPIAANTSHHIMLARSGSSNLIRVDGTDETEAGRSATTAPGSFSGVAMYFGMGSFNSEFFIGNVAYLAVLDPATSDDEILKLEGWAAHKYGLTANLPGGHPYKSVAP